MMRIMTSTATKSHDIHHLAQVFMSSHLTGVCSIQKVHPSW